MGRLQLKLPQRQAGKRHQKSSTTTPVTFDDVAGVDEAKEELEEVVVSGNDRFGLSLTIHQGHILGPLR